MTAHATSAGWRDNLWDYATRVYSHKEVENIVLDLQDDYYANVNIILWLCWLEEEAIFLSRELLDDVLITVDTVNQSTLIKLREVRKFIKDTGSFTQVQSKLINKQLLNAELMVEKILVHRLQDLTRRSMDVMTNEQEPLNLAYYLDFLGIPDARQIARLARSACRSAHHQSVNSKIYKTAHALKAKTPA